MFKIIAWAAARLLLPCIALIIGLNLVGKSIETELITAGITEQRFTTANVQNPHFQVMDLNRKLPVRLYPHLANIVDARLSFQNTGLLLTFFETDDSSPQYIHQLYYFDFLNDTPRLIHQSINEDRYVSKKIENYYSPGLTYGEGTPLLALFDPSDSTLYVINLETGESMPIITLTEGNASSIVWSPDQSFFTFIKSPGGLTASKPTFVIAHLDGRIIELENMIENWSSFWYPGISPDQQWLIVSEYHFQPLITPPPFYVVNTKTGEIHPTAADLYGYHTRWICPEDERQQIGYIRAEDLRFTVLDMETGEQTVYPPIPDMESGTLPSPYVTLPGCSQVIIYAQAPDFSNMSYFLLDSITQEASLLREGNTPSNVSFTQDFSTMIYSEKEPGTNLNRIYSVSLFTDEAPTLLTEYTSHLEIWSVNWNSSYTRGFYTRGANGYGPLKMIVPQHNAEYQLTAEDELVFSFHLRN